MRLSRYVHKHEVAEGIIGLYSPFGHEVSFLPSSELNSLIQGDFTTVPPAVISDLKERRFLVEEGFEDHILKEYDPDDEPVSEMWLVLVQSCNMSCQYCVVEGNVDDPSRRAVGKSGVADFLASVEKLVSTPADKVAARQKAERAQTETISQRDAHGDWMSTEVADAAVQKFSDMVAQSKSQMARIVMYGGEPLLNQGTLRHSVKSIRKTAWPHLERRPSILVITNGQIYRDELTRFFKSYGVSVSVSLDGMKHHHDPVRVNLSGKPTFDRAVASLRRYIEAGLNCGICTTIGSHNVEDLPEIVDYFAKEFGVPVELEPPFDIPNLGGNDYYVRMAEAAPKVMEAFKRLRGHGVIEGLGLRRLAKLAQGEFHHRDCGAVGGQWVIAPDGMIGPCHSMVGERKYFSGDVRDRGCSPDSEAQFSEWSRRTPVNMPDCHGCSAIGICGGGCPYNALIKTGSIWNKDPQQCEYMDYMLNWSLEDMWERYDDTQSTAQEPFPLARAI